MGDQGGLRVASNGSVTLAVWSDGRNGGAVTACRITADGKLLDPVGMVLKSASEGTEWEVCDVFWTGTSFAVVTDGLTFTQSGAEGAYAVTYVDPDDGSVTQGSTLASLDLGYGGHVGRGAETRLLFLESDGNWPGPSVADLQGNVIGSVFRAPIFASRYVLAATNGSGFLSLLEIDALSNEYEVSPATYKLEVVNGDGDSLSLRDSHFPPSFVPKALTGDGHGGYALFGDLPSTKEFVLLHLDATGVATGPPQSVYTYDSSEPGSVYATTTGEDFFVSWSVNLPNGHAYTYVSSNGGAPVLMSDRIGLGFQAVYEPVSDRLFTAFEDPLTFSGIDVFFQKGSEAPAPLTYSTNDQASPAIGAGANGFLAAWTEQPRLDSLLYVRRFASDGKPLEDPQVADTIPIASGRGYQHSSVASSGGTYLVAWDASFARRLDARSGQWLDFTSFPLRSMAAASNGTDFLALTLDECPQVCTTARRVSMSGNATVSDGVKLSDFGLASDPAIATDGQNYLAVWTDGVRVLAMRLRPDGSHIDAAPIVLDPSSAHLACPSVAWNGNTYLVTWATTYYGGNIAAAYVGSDASVQRLGAITQKIENPITSLKAVAYGDAFVIFSRHETPTSISYPLPDVFDMTLVDGSTMVFGETRTTDVIGSMDAASDGVHLMLAYARVDPTAGRAHRVVLDPRVFPSRKRAVR